MIELLLEAERALSFGLTDRAEELYRQVADADPRNSIAVVGLARVALDRGDDLGAYLLARRALAIDPENDAARRLATRLEEVLATRGEPVADPMLADEAASRPGADASATPVPGEHRAGGVGVVADATPDSRDPSSSSPPSSSPTSSSTPTPSPATPTPAARRSFLDRLRGR